MFHLLVLFLFVVCSELWTLSPWTTSAALCLNPGHKELRLQPHAASQVSFYHKSPSNLFCVLESCSRWYGLDWAAGWVRVHVCACTCVCVCFLCVCVLVEQVTWYSLQHSPIGETQINSVSIFLYVYMCAYIQNNTISESKDTRTLCI